MPGDLLSRDVQIDEVRTAEDREAAFALRMLVFVEEQLVPPEEELDAYDVTATHFLVRLPSAGCEHPLGIIGTARLVSKGSGIGKIGRVAIHAHYRGLGLGAALMRRIEDHALKKGFVRLDLDAQCYAIPFYEKLGYIAEGEIFLDAAIEHRFMSKSLSARTH